MFKKILFFFILSLILSCRIINPSLMFKTGDKYPYATIKDTINPEYKIEPDDRFTFSLYTNEGYKLIDLTNLGGNTNNSSSSAASSTNSNIIEYSVDKDGNARLPQLDKVNVKDKTVPEAEKLLEDKYSVYYRAPFVKIKIINKRVLVFPGEGGAGSVVNLTNDNTTLIEALALAGGIRFTGKAYNIKLIRGNLSNPKIYHIDLSTVDGMKSGDIIMQANDIIYVEPVRNTSQGVLAQITPVVAIITTVLLVYQISRGK